MCVSTQPHKALGAAGSWFLVISRQTSSGNRLGSRDLNNEGWGLAGQQSRARSQLHALTLTSLVLPLLPLPPPPPLLQSHTVLVAWRSRRSTALRLFAPFLFLLMALIVNLALNANNALQVGVLCVMCASAIVVLTGV